MKLNESRWYFWVSYLGSRCWERWESENRVSFYQIFVARMENYKKLIESKNYYESELESIFQNAIFPEIQEVVPEEKNWKRWYKLMVLGD